MFTSVKRGFQWASEKLAAATLAVSLAVTGAVMSASLLMPVDAMAQGTTLIPDGSLDTAVADIQATGEDAFSIIVPVVVIITALLIAVKLIKRFLNRA